MAVHHGSCHCGAVRFDVDMELQGLITCNCSICGRTGSIMAFVPKSTLTQTAGEDQLSDYQFGKKTIHHVFCKTCGVRPFAWGVGQKGEEYAMINVRCLDDVDVHKVTIAQQYDGKSL
jgi:hypothetical protein